MKPWHVYLLECADGSCYCGVTTDLARRLRQHNGLLKGGAAFTRSRRPVRLLCSREIAEKSAALKLEAAIKKLRKPCKVSFLARHSDA